MGHFHKVYLQQIIFKCKPSSVREEIKQKYTVEHIPWSRLKTRRENILDLVEKSVKSPMAHIPYLGSVCVWPMYTGSFSCLFIIQNTFAKPLVCISSSQYDCMLTI